MRITQKTMNLINGKDTYLTFNEAEECPICHAKIVGKYLASAIWQNNNQDCATTLNFCTGCCNVFINCYNIKFERKDTLSLAYYHTVNLISSDPKHLKHGFLITILKHYRLVLIQFIIKLSKQKQ